MVDFDWTTSPDQMVRQKASVAIKEVSEENPSELVSSIPKIIEIVSSHDDSFVVLQLSLGLSYLNNSFPQEVQTYLENIFTALENLSKRQQSEDNYWDSCMIYLLGIITPLFNTNPMLLQSKLSLMLSMMEKSETVRNHMNGPILTLGMQNASLFQDYADEFLSIFLQGFMSIGTILPSLYSLNPSVFDSRVDEMIQVYKTNPMLQSMILQLLNPIASRSPSSFSEETVTLLQADLPSMMLGSSIMMIFQHLAGTTPSLLVQSVDSLMQACTQNTNLIFQIPGVLSVLGREFPEKSKSIMAFLINLLDIANDDQDGIILNEVRNLVDFNIDLLEPYEDKIRALENHNKDMIRNQAKMIIDIVEGRTIRQLASKIDENNKKISEAATSTEALMEYIDDNIAMVKDFIADIIKKLPTPNSFDTQGRIRKTLILNFVCDEEGERCIFPHDRPFTTETKSWSKWLKVAFAGVKLGRCLILPAAIGDAGKAVKEAYEAYKTEDDKEFLKYISEPFLTSSEQDELIEQLRAAKFFDVFGYDAQEAHWNCTMCNLM